MKWLPVLRSADCLEDFLLFKKPGTKSVALNYFGSKADESGKVLAKGEDRSVCRSHKKAVLARVVLQQTFTPSHSRDHHPDLNVEAAPSCSGMTSRQQPTL